MKKNNQPIVKRGEVYYAQLAPTVGSEQGGLRPVVIVQNDVGNKHSPTTIVVPLTSQLLKKPLPTHQMLEDNCGLSCISVALCEQIRTIDKSRLQNRIGCADDAVVARIDKALKISLGLN